MMGRHDPRRDREFPPRWTIALGILLILGCLMWTVWSINSSKQEAEDASTSANALADQVAAACEEGSVEVGGRDICKKADQVKKNVDQGEEGPEGPRGPRGLPGPRSTIPGPAGSPGEDGEDSDIPGPAGEPGEDGEPGEQGAPGEDSDVPGPTGAPGEDSTAPGPKGSKGEKGSKGDKGNTGPPGPKGEKGSPGSDGKPGRGISDVSCTSDGDWQFDFTDGTTITVTGPCRAQTAPAPTSTPTTTP